LDADVVVVENAPKLKEGQSNYRVPLVERQAGIGGGKIAHHDRREPSNRCNISDS
jgi:hypothetical protein